MQGFRERALRAYEGLREINIAGGRQRIPLMENLHKRLLRVASSPAELGETIDLLVQTDHILRIEVDRTPSKQPVYALVVLDVDVLREAKSFAFSELEILYEYEQHTKKTAEAILVDFAQRDLTQTSVPFRRFFRLAKALSDRAEQMAANPGFASPQLRSARLEEALKERSGSGTPARAADSPEAATLRNVNLRGEWGRVVRMYGVQFIVRVHLRKHEFGLVTQLIREKRIAQEQDLRYIRDLVRTMESRATLDPVLKSHLPSIAELRKAAQVSMIQSLRITPVRRSQAEAPARPVEQDHGHTEFDLYDGI
jgi:hypothetical protein